MKCRPASQIDRPDVTVRDDAPSENLRSLSRHPVRILTLRIGKAPQGPEESGVESLTEPGQPLVAQRVARVLRIAIGRVLPKFDPVVTGVGFDVPS